jgi:hypothetical protein
MAPDLDAAIPLSGITPRFNNPFTQLGDIQAQQQRQQQSAQQQHIAQQTIEENQGKLADQARNRAAQATTAALVQQHTTVDPTTGLSTTDHQAVYQGLAQQYPDHADTYLATADAAEDSFNKWQINKMNAARVGLKYVGDQVAQVIAAPPDQKQAAWNVALGLTQAANKAGFSPFDASALPAVYPGDAQAQTYADMGKTQDEKLATVLTKADIAVKQKAANAPTATPAGDTLTYPPGQSPAETGATVVPGGITPQQQATNALTRATLAETARRDAETARAHRATEAAANPFGIVPSGAPAPVPAAGAPPVAPSAAPPVGAPPVPSQAAPAPPQAPSGPSGGPPAPAGLARPVAAPVAAVAPAPAVPRGTAPAAAGPAVPATGPTGDDFLRTLPPGLAIQVKSYAEGRQAFPSGMALRTPYFQQMLQAVGQYDPDFDATIFNARNQMRKQLSSITGPVGSLNTAVAHLGTLQTAADALGNGNVQLYNKIANSLKTQFTGWTGQTDFNTIAPKMAKEIEKLWSGAGGSEAGEMRTLGTLNTDMAQPQINDAIAKTADLVNGKLQSMEFQKRQVFGTHGAGSDIQITSPQTQAILARLQSGGAAAPAGAGLQTAAAAHLQSVGRASDPASVAKFLQLNPGWTP